MHTAEAECVRKNITRRHWALAPHQVEEKPNDDDGKGGPISSPAGCHVATPSCRFFALGWRWARDKPSSNLDIYWQPSLPSCLSSRPCSSSLEPHIQLGKGKRIKGDEDIELYGSALLQLYSYNQFLDGWTMRCGDCACALYFDRLRTVNIWSGKVLKTSSDPGDLAEKQEIKS